MNRLFVSFTQYSFGPEDNHLHCFVVTKSGNTVQLGDTVTPASRRRIECLVRDAADLGLSTTVQISNLSFTLVINRFAEENEYVKSLLKKYPWG